MNDDTPSVIAGTTTTIKTLVDGTFRVSIDISPADAQAAFALFGRPGTPVALARLSADAAVSNARKETVDALKGGALCKLAGIFCNDEKFRDWLRITYDPLLRTPEEAAKAIRDICDIESRTELDHNDEAERRFHARFRLPYNAWLDGRNK